MTDYERENTVWLHIKATDCPSLKINAPHF